MTLVELQPPRRAPTGVVDPLAVAHRELALDRSPSHASGAALGVIAEAAGHKRSATADRLRRLAARGEVVKVGDDGGSHGKSRTSPLKCLPKAALLHSFRARRPVEMGPPDRTIPANRDERIRLCTIRLTPPRSLPSASDAVVSWENGAAPPGQRCAPDRQAAMERAPDD